MMTWTHKKFTTNIVISALIGGAEREFLGIDFLTSGNIFGKVLKNKIKNY